MIFWVQISAFIHHMEEIVSEHTENSIGDTVDGILLKRYRIDDIPKISVVRKGDVWVTADNRRLWVFKTLESLGQCARISVIIKKRISNKKSVVQKDIKVRGDPGGIFYKLKTQHQMNFHDVLLAMSRICLDTK